MRYFFHRFICTSLCIVIAGCSTPRGAGFQSEVLSAATARDFSVYAVTRDTLPTLKTWPRVDTLAYPWIRHSNQPASLIIAPGDILKVTIWDAEENSLLSGPGQRAAQLQELQVATDGRIFIPFVGELRVAGMAPNTARARIEEELVNTVPSAQVQLSVVPGPANTANLVSGVNAPGVYPLVDRSITVLDLLSTGGGVQGSLVNPQVRLMRGNRVYGISLARLYEEPVLDTTLRGGDRIIIKADERQFLSLGATGTESVHIFPKNDITALEAMAIVGGVSDARANPQGILILREYDAGDVRNDGSGPPQQRVVFTVDLTTADGLFSAGQFAIQPNDLVYATESPILPALTIVGLVNTASNLGN